MLLLRACRYGSAYPVCRRRGRGVLAEKILRPLATIRSGGGILWLPACFGGSGRQFSFSIKLRKMTFLSAFSTISLTGTGYRSRA